MTSRILLVRHGRSAHDRRPGWIDAAGVQRWRDTYDAAAIAADDAPPAALIAQAAGANVIAASEAARAVASAERLARGRGVAVTPLLRETVLDVPAWLPLCWPLAVWEAAIHLQWGYRILRGTDARDAESKRAAEAADWLASHARAGGMAIAVTHGVFRRLLARRLLADGWVADPGRRSYATWSIWGFRRE